MFCPSGTKVNHVPCLRSFSATQLRGLSSCSDWQILVTILAICYAKKPPLPEVSSVANLSNLMSYHLYILKKAEEPASKAFRAFKIPALMSSFRRCCTLEFPLSHFCPSSHVLRGLYIPRDLIWESPVKLICGLVTASTR